MSRAIDDLTWKPLTTKDRIKLTIEEHAAQLDHLEAYCQHLEREILSLHKTMFDQAADLAALTQVVKYVWRSSGVEDFGDVLNREKREYVLAVQEELQRDRAARGPWLWFAEQVAIAASISENHRMCFERFWVEVGNYLDCERRALDGATEA